MCTTTTSRVIAMALAAVSLAGCAVHSGPSENPDFVAVTHPAQLEGLYANNGDPSGHLSDVIWGRGTAGSPPVPHDAIEFIEVVATGDALVAKAISGGCAVFEERFAIGRDVVIEEGLIVIKRELDLLTRGGDDPLLGPTYEKVTLGLDAANQGKYRSSGFGAGLVYGVFPIAVSATSDVRFERIAREPPGYLECRRRPVEAEGD